MIHITQPYPGQVLNRRQGEATAAGLRVTLRGTVRGAATVHVNGQPTPALLGEFSTPVELLPGRNELVATADGALGQGRHTVEVWYDPHGAQRYRLSVDDNSFWLRELALHPTQYGSLFDCFYLRLWRDLHERFGLQVVLNIYYRTADGFTLDQFPERWKAEFEASADWLKLAWHAAANDPDRPYEYTGYDQIAHDLELVEGHIRRFAGEGTCSQPTVVHWAEATRQGVQALLDRGVRNLSGLFYQGAGRPVGVYHLRDERAELADHCAQWIDRDTGLAFSRIDLVINNTPLEQVAPRLEALVAQPAHAEILDLFTHEQYFWPFYQRYVPDHFQRCEAAVRWVTEQGFRPCWFHEGFLGGPEIR